jgi:ParB-like chromosome segregation protein Spo0J
MTSFPGVDIRSTKAIAFSRMGESVNTANPDSFATALVSRDVDGPRQEHGCQSDRYPTVTISIDCLRSADSPRLAGESSEHTRTLAESEVILPPIVVHRSTMRVIDGMHRLQAAKLSGRDTIEVQFYDGDEADIFVLAVARNIAHGLPLSRSDRTAAAARIVSSHPQWSDRKIASVTGLSATTVGTIRMRSTDNSGQSHTRVGRDGRTRPVSGAVGREVAAELIKAKPDTSIRDIAAAAGISSSTAQDVRKRLRNGKNPLPWEENKQRNAAIPKRTESTCPEGGKREDPAQHLEWKSALHRLQRDPSLRFTDTGRALLRLLDSHLIDAEQWARFTANIPAHCTRTIAELARLAGNSWHKFAEQLMAEDTQQA